MNGLALGAALVAVFVAVGVSVAAVVLGVAGFGLIVLAVHVREVLAVRRRNRYASAFWEDPAVVVAGHVGRVA